MPATRTNASHGLNPPPHWEQLKATRKQNIRNITVIHRVFVDVFSGIILCFTSTFLPTLFGKLTKYLYTCR